MKKSPWLPLLIALFAALAGTVSATALPQPPKQGGMYVVAHRGAHQGIPENTLAAYQKAIELGCDFVEIDVRTSRDGELVSVHNATVEAYTGGEKRAVRDLTLAELKALDIGSRVGPEWKDERVPTLEEILTLCAGKIGIYLDLKEADPAAIIPLLRQHGMAGNTVWYAPPRMQEAVKTACSECVLMPDPGPERNLPRTLERFKPQVIASSWDQFSKAFLDTCRAAGAMCFVDESDASCWPDAVAWGVEGIQTDDPEGLIAFLKAKAVPAP